MLEYVLLVVIRTTYLFLTLGLTSIDISRSAGPTLESKGMGATFQKKGKSMLKKSKIFKNLGKNVQNLNIF